MRKINLILLSIIASVYILGFVLLVFLLSMISDKLRVDTLIFRDVQAGFVMIFGFLLSLAILISGILFRKAQKNISALMFVLAVLSLLLGIGLLPATLITAWMGLIHLQAKEGGSE